MVAHLASHTQSLEHSRRISASTDGTRFSQTVVLTVSCLTNAIEMMAFHYALEALTFADAADINKFAFHEHVDGERFAQLFSVAFFETRELAHQFLRSRAGLGKVAKFSLSGILLLFLIET